MDHIQNHFRYSSRLKSSISLLLYSNFIRSSRLEQHCPYCGAFVLSCIVAKSNLCVSGFIMSIENENDLQKLQTRQSAGKKSFSWYPSAPSCNSLCTPSNFPPQGIFHKRQLPRLSSLIQQICFLCHNVPKHERNS